MLGHMQRDPSWPGITEISRACPHTAISSRAPLEWREIAQPLQSLPACAYSKGLLYKHQGHSWNCKDLGRVRAEADSLRKQKHARIQPRSSGTLTAKLALKSQRNWYQDGKQHYQLSLLPMGPEHFSSYSTQAIWEWQGDLVAEGPSTYSMHQYKFGPEAIVTEYTWPWNSTCLYMCTMHMHRNIHYSTVSNLTWKCFNRWTDKYNQSVDNNGITHSS
jgi:hypothetical protein